MGLRYRKSYNFKGFRVNFSKSGIGYSYGFPGFRYTITANGKQRITTSIPGTGISYVEEFGENKKYLQENFDDDNIERVQNIDLNNTSLEYTSLISECQKWVDTWYKNIKFILYANIISVVIFFVLWLINLDVPLYIYLIIMICINFYGFYNLYNLKSNKVNIYYDFKSGNDIYNEFVDLFNKIPKSEKIWYVDSIINNIERRKNAGAKTSTDLKNLSITYDAPFFMDTNIKCVNIKFSNDNLYILPDKILLYKQRKVRAVNLNTINLSLSTKNYVVYNDFASDSEILFYTWKYVNNNGSPDRRFKNNGQVPICRYGQLEINGPDALRIVITVSNHNNACEFFRKWLIFDNKLNKIYKIKENDDSERNNGKLFKNSNLDLEYSIAKDGTQFYNLEYSGNAFLLTDYNNVKFDDEYLIINRDRVYAFGEYNIDNIKKLSSKDLILLNRVNEGVVAMGTVVNETFQSLDNCMCSLELSNIIKLDKPISVNDLKLILGKEFNVNEGFLYISLENIKRIAEKIENSLNC